MQKGRDESSRLRAANGPSYRSIDAWSSQSAVNEACITSALGDRTGGRHADAEVDAHTRRVQNVQRTAMIGLFVLAMAVERYSFKLLADVMEPYRVLVLLLLLLVSIALYACILAVKKALQMHIETATHQLPQKRIAMIGCLDALQLAMQFLAAPNVSPAMTLILLHAMTPISILLSKIAYPERKYTQLHVAGALLVALSVVIGLLHAAVISNRALTCAAVYALGALPAALSNMYKESTIVSFSRPIDIHVFNSWIFSYQFFFLLLASPFLYACQGIVSSMSDYPIGSFSSNLEDGFGCLFGVTPTDLDAVTYSTEAIQCSPFHVIVLLSFVAGTALVILCVNYILGVTTSVAFTRSLVVAVAVSFVVLLIYDGKQSSADDAPVHTTEIVALMCLLAGLEISGWDEEPDTQIFTRFQSTP